MVGIFIEIILLIVGRGVVVRVLSNCVLVVFVVMGFCGFFFINWFRLICLERVWILNCLLLEYIRFVLFDMFRS